MARAPVSKTGGCRFESCHSCQGPCRDTYDVLAKTVVELTDLTFA